MKILGIWTIFVALSISVVAAYYSIVGLVAIFAAAAIPIIIMGSVLEVAKITTAVWLHTNWKNAAFLIKAYLTSATVLLMFITSMGIFGFLSKAHIEQTAVATEGAAQLVRIQTEIERNEAIISRAEQKIVKLETADNTADEQVQRKIEAELARIDATTQRIETTVQDLQTTLESSIEPWQLEFETAVEQLNKLDALTSINTRNRDAVRELQAFIKARPDGSWGPKTAAKVEEFKQRVETSKQDSLSKIEELRNQTATEIQRVRGIAEREIAQANTVIVRLQEQLGTTRNDNREQEIDDQLVVIANATSTVDDLISKKYDIEAEARMLEAEVGPVKYIAELVYGDNAGKDTLEEAVRWVILILVIVFDPLAVVLVISGISLLEQTHKKPVAKTTTQQYNNNTIEVKTNEKAKQSKTHEKDAETETQNVKSMGVEERSESKETESKNYQENTEFQEPVIVYQGIEYAPTHREYDRVKAQIELNSNYRKLAQKEEALNKIVDTVTDIIEEEDIAILKKRIDEFDDDTVEMVRQADSETIKTVYNEIIKDK